MLKGALNSTIIADPLFVPKANNLGIKKHNADSTEPSASTDLALQHQRLIADSVRYRCALSRRPVSASRQVPYSYQPVRVSHFPFNISSGWYSRPPPPMQRRGRSRQVSTVALARQASEERRQTVYNEKHCQPQIVSSTSFFIQVAPPTSLLLQSEDSEADPPSSSLHHVPASSPIPHPSSSIDIQRSKADLISVSPRSLSPTPEPSVSSDDSSSSASVSPDLYDSPPSPPRSLEDQVQVAYALDDIRLAKILLLKLKGIEVTSDHDPRIDEVRDEDFDMCFVPAGPLVLEEADKRAVQETQRRQRELWEEKQRMDRLKACEQIWEQEKQRLQSERLQAIRKREEELAFEEERRRVAEAKEREEAERTQRQRSSRVGFSMAHRDAVSYGTLSQARLERCSAKREEEPFQYSFMPPSTATSTTPPRHSVVGSPRSPKLKKTHSLQPSSSRQRTVSFKEVVHSMHGRLFPLEPAEREEAKRLSGVSTITSVPRRGAVRAELLESLLQVVEWQEGERRRTKGKAVDRSTQLGKSPLSTPTPIDSVLSAPSTSLESSSVATSRSGSWLSFGSWRSSVSTDITTPSASPISLPAKYDLSLSPAAWESASRCYPQQAFVSVTLEDSPLSPLRPRRFTYDEKDTWRDHTVLPLPGLSLSADATIESTESMRNSFVRRVSRSVSGFVDVAKGLQSAYITATMFSVGSSYAIVPKSPSQQPQLASPRRRARLPGYRALATDVKKFTACTTFDDGVPQSEPVHFIPLVSPFPIRSVTVRPGPASPPALVPSPLRPRTPPTVLAYRMRPVANPAVLRLRALQNLMCARGKEWEGRAREGGLGCGKERMLGIAFEGRGRSGLGCEVRFVVS
ncbi:hypothetical protein BV22DRAFT_1093882 [Leucogyrophana mollusca]|uniref:Uncharacterized protein n=1 Tax=Leucogyrophana mollusca TaxID=85980 RepID=A0ACB8BC26_9AGAM|nr:hypothetical protein BV22DRAFT_1093882 [Leucogyrophana mollusca]